MIGDQRMRNKIFPYDFTGVLGVFASCETSENRFVLICKLPCDRTAGSVGPLTLKHMQTKFTLKNDKYRKARGGYSRFLNIFCDSCGEYLALYQKDGPGELKRMYLDRVFAPKIPASKTGAFTCHACKKIIGTFYTYKKETRPAIRLYQGSVSKKIATGAYSLS